MHFEDSIDFAKKLDVADPPEKFREKFIIPVLHDKEQIYFLGNSLGLQPKATREEIAKILDQWGQYGVEAFFIGNDPWINYQDRFTKTLARIVGAMPTEVCVMNQLTVNLHLLLVSFYEPQRKRNKILCEAKAFPSDQYMLETHLRHYGFDPEETIIEVKPRFGEHLIRHEDILSALQIHKDEIALVLFSGLNYYSGQVFNIEQITEVAHTIGARVGFDLAHAAGNIELRLHDWDVDFACWCTYKYLNSGPGGVGGVYIHERFHRDKNLQRYGGWWGQDKATRFLMQKGFNPIPTAEGWQLSTPSLLLYAAHKAALDIFETAGWENVVAKGRRLNDFLWFLLTHLLESGGDEYFDIITPTKPEERGCQVSLLMLKNGKKVFEQLTTAGIITDWREPDLIRLAPVPLYNTFEEVWSFANTLRQILKIHA
jgi:kynureninase